MQAVCHFCFEVFYTQVTEGNGIGPPAHNPKATVKTSTVICVLRNVCSLLIVSFILMVKNGRIKIVLQNCCVASFSFQKEGATFLRRQLDTLRTLRSGDDDGRVCSFEGSA